MSKGKYLIWALLVALVLIGCAGMLSEGTVIDKEYTPAHTQVTVRPVGSGNTTRMETQTRHVPECYVLIVRGPREDREVTARWQVSKIEYDAVQVGQFVRAQEFTNQARVIMGSGE